MQKNLAKYFVMSSYILGGIILLVGIVYAIMHWSDIRVRLYQRVGQEEMSGGEETAEEQEVRLGRILKTKTGGEYTGMKKRGKTTLTESKVRSDFLAGGFGVLVDGETMLSAAHVLADGDTLYFYNDSVGLVLIGEKEADIEHDLARARVTTGKKLPAITIAGEVQEGQKVYSWTNSAYRPEKVEGVILNPERTITMQAVWGEVQAEELPVMSIAMENNLGDSGMPVYNEAGELIGIIVGVDAEDVNVSYAAKVQ